jgi:hypothetical protein
MRRRQQWDRYNANGLALHQRVVVHGPLRLSRRLRQHGVPGNDLPIHNAYLVVNAVGGVSADDFVRHCRHVEQHVGAGDLHLFGQTAGLFKHGAVIACIDEVPGLVVADHTADAHDDGHGYQHADEQLVA